jgi:soluble cytochrome b562
MDHGKRDEPVCRSPRLAFVFWTLADGTLLPCRSSCLRPVSRRFSMNKLILLLVAALVLAPSVTLAQAKKKDRPDTEIEKAMDQMAGAVRKLRSLVTDPAQTATSLELVATIKAGALEAKKHVPLRAADVPEGDRAAFVADFQKRMEAFVAAVAKVERALKDGKNDEAGRLFQELGRLQKAGHKDFQRPEEKEMK